MSRIARLAALALALTCAAPDASPLSPSPAVASQVRAGRPRVRVPRRAVRRAPARRPGVRARVKAFTKGLGQAVRGLVRGR